MCAMVDVNSVGGKLLFNTMEALDKRSESPGVTGFSCGNGVLTGSHRQCSCCSCVALE